MAQPTPAWKRTIDVIGAIVGLVAAAPLLLVFAAAIKLTSRGPVFYSQEREGLGGRRFRIYKLRTMRPDAEQHQSDLLRATANRMARRSRCATIRAPRGLAAGCGKTSLDELPQFWNVLRGEMSLVGPRPLPIRESLQCLPWQRQRLLRCPRLDLYLAGARTEHRALYRVDADGPAVYPPQVVAVRPAIAAEHGAVASYCSEGRDDAAGHLHRVGIN